MVKNWVAEFKRICMSTNDKPRSATATDMIKKSPYRIEWSSSKSAQDTQI